MCYCFGLKSYYLQNCLNNLYLLRQFYAKISGTSQRSWRDKKEFLLFHLSCCTSVILLFRKCLIWMVVLICSHAVGAHVSLNINTRDFCPNIFLGPQIYLCPARYPLFQLCYFFFYSSTLRSFCYLLSFIIFVFLFPQNNVYSCYFSVCGLLDHYRCTKWFRPLPGIICLQHFALLRSSLWSSGLSIISFRVPLTSVSSLKRKVAVPKALVCKLCTKYIPPWEMQLPDLSDGQTPCTRTACSSYKPYVKSVVKIISVGSWLRNHRVPFLTVAPSCGPSWCQSMSSCSVADCLFYGCFLHKTTTGECL